MAGGAALSLLLTGCLKASLITVSNSQIQDATAPTAPTAFDIASIPAGTTSSAVFSWNASVDSGSGIARYEIKIFRSSNGAVIQDWTTISPNTSVSGLSLDEDLAYYATLRAVDNAGNISSEATSVAWLPNSDGCKGTMLTGTPYAGGSGTHADPYQLCTPAQVAAIAANTAHFGSSFKLLANVNFSGVSFDGIGGASVFYGRFLGNSKKVKNMTITRAAGNDVGFFNKIQDAYVSNLTLENPSVTGATSSAVGAVIGYCIDSSLHGITVTTGTVSGSTRVGILMGRAGGCKSVDVNIAGTASVSTDAVGGVIGYDDANTFIDVTASVTVSAPGVGYAGGFGGQNIGATTYVQNADVTGTVTADWNAGGFFGYVGDGIQVNRSSFTGTINSTWYGGGFVGEVGDSPCDFYSSYANVTINGTEGLGGFVGMHNYATNIYDSYATGTINTSGGSQASVGGFHGEVGWGFNLARSFNNVNIVGSATKAGGAFGDVNYWLGNSIQNVFVAGNVQGSAATNLVSWFTGSFTAGNAINATNAYYWSGATCDNTGAGNCNTTHGTSEAAIGTFYDKNNLPLSNWNFTSIWQENASALPTLRRTQSVTPSVTHACATTATSGMAYNCALTITDTDSNEIQTVLIQEDHTCDWMRVSLSGTPQAGDVGNCQVSAVVTDGANESAPIQFTIAVGP